MITHRTILVSLHEVEYSSKRMVITKKQKQKSNHVSNPPPCTMEIATTNHTTRYFHCARGSIRDMVRLESAGESLPYKEGTSLRIRQVRLRGSRYLPASYILTGEMGFTFTYTKSILPCSPRQDAPNGTIFISIESKMKQGYEAK